MNLKNIIKIATVLLMGSCSQYDKINERKIGQDLVQLYQSRQGDYKLVINEPAKHAILKRSVQDGTVRTFYLDNKFNIESESVEKLVLPIGEGYGYQSERIPEEDRAKAEACIDSLLNLEDKTK